MINAKRAVLKEYVNIISGITYNGNPLPVYDGTVPSDAGSIYVVISGLEQRDLDGKQNFNSQVNISLDIVTKTANFGYKTAEEIASLILASINADHDPDLSAYGLQCYSTELVGNTNLDSLIPTDNVYRVILRYQHLISQL